MASLAAIDTQELQSVEYSIRPGTIEDVGRMTLILEHALAGRSFQPLPNEPSDPLRRFDLYGRMINAGSWAFLAETVDRPAAFVLGHPTETEQFVDDEKNVDYLSMLMTEPEFWGAGIGGKLLDVAAQNARTLGRSSLVLWVLETNHRARNLYESKGYLATDTQLWDKDKGVLEQYRLDLA